MNVIVRGGILARSLRTVSAISLLFLWAFILCSNAHAQTVFLGDVAVENTVDSSANGTAEAFQATATASGQVSFVNVFLDPTSTATKVIVGIYADASGRPGSLLTQGSSTQLTAGTWNGISVTAINVVAGTPYWIAILGMQSGTLVFRDQSGGSCSSQASSQTNLTTMPGSWSSGSTFDTCPLSVYGSNALPPGPDTIIGDDSIEHLLDSNPAGRAEAFQATANSSSTIGAISLYLDPTSHASDVIVGIYADNNCAPGTLLGQGSTSQPVAGGWNQISISPASVTAGQPYWIAVLGTGGLIEFRDRNAGSCTSVTTTQTTLTALPSAWTTHESFSTCPVSAYGLLGTASTLPLANAGPAQTVALNAQVQLDGTGSTDPRGNPLTYQWSIVSVPTGSTAALSSATAVRPTFVADKLGNYTIKLVVSDGTQTSLPATVIISTTNSAPVANAGPAQTVHVSATVQLDGSGSTDVDGDALTYSWMIATKPSGSNATLANSSFVNPTFVADVAGSYTIQLIVNDGHANSAPSQVIISTTNSAPVAKPGPDQLVLVGTTVSLDGSGSTDVDGNTLTYSWAILTKPSGSSAALSSSTAVNPTFVADANGTYVLQLIVNDGTVNSAPATVTIATDNIPPIANAGPNQSKAIGGFVTLDGSASSAVGGRTLGYRWAMVSKPSASNAALNSALTIHPNFTVDVAGTYVVQLIVNDGYSNSAPGTVVISTINSAPVANPKPNQSVTVGTTVHLSGSNSSDADGDPLTYSWALLYQPSGGTAVLANANTVAPTFVPNVTGIYIAQLIVNDGKVNSIPATVTINANVVNQPPVVNAGPNQTISLPTTTVTLNGTATDDGLPNGTLIIQWTQVSGPGTVTFSTPNQASTQVTLPTVGSYVLKLTANDSQLSSSSTVTVTLTQANQPPVVTVGPDQTITYPTTTANLTGSVNDDGLPFGNSLTIAWSKVVGPGPVTFSTPSQQSTQAIFTIPGNYVLRLSASDGQYTTSATMRVVFVAPATGAISVSAGPDQVLVFPNAATLSGSASDSNPPTGSTLSLSWSTVSGPGTATFSNPSSLSTQAIFSKPGVYDLRLTATNGIYTASSDVKVYEGNLKCTSSNKGTDFWLTFTEPPQQITPRQLSLFISSDVATSGTVSVPGQGFNQPFTVTPGQITTINLPQSFELTSSDVVETKGIHVTSQNAVAVYGFDFVSTVSDGYLGLPTNTLGTSYLVASYRNTVDNAGAPTFATEFGIVATQDNTNITIIPTATSGTTSATGNRLIGQPFTITLNQGQTYQLQNTRDHTEFGVVNGSPVDFTGTAVTSDKPIAVFGGHGCADIPDGSGTCNSLIEQMPPTNLWGQNFVTMPLASELNGDTFRFLAQADNTHLLVNHQEVAILQKGQFFEQILKQPSEISANNPILTVQYANSYLFAGNPNVDPSMMVVPPFEQFGGSYTVNTPTSNFPINFINVVAPTAAAQNSLVLMDGVPIPAVLFQQIGTSPFSGAQVTASVGPHVLTAGLPFGVWVYGFNAQDAYGYTGGVCFTSGVSNTTLTTTPRAATNQITSQATVQTTLTNLSGQPVGGEGVTFTLTGVNPQTFNATTDANGVATFSYMSLVTGSDLVTITAGTSSDTASVTWVSNGPNQPPIVKAGPNQTISLPTNSVSLNGSVIDDGLPIGGTLTSTWSVVSAPTGATVSFSLPNQPQTSATFSAAGTYVLQLTGNDSLLSTSANVTVRVLPPNQPPVVSVGPNQVFMWFVNSTQFTGLTATATDDGLPVGSTLTKGWSQISGPGIATLDPANSDNPNVTLPVPGTYIFQYSANDSQFTTTANVMIQAYGLVSANLGPNLQTIVGTPVALNSNVLVANQPPTAAMPLQLTWSATAGPNGSNVSFSSPNTASTTATFDTPGTYQLGFSAVDANRHNLAGLSQCCLTVTVGAQGVALPHVTLATPLDGAQITAPTTVTGSVDSGTWTLDTALQDDFHPLVFTTIATGTNPVSSGGTLGTFDPTLLLNGTYVLRLTSVNSAGQFSTTSITLSVARNMKVGVFSLSFNDMTIPVPGVPIQVIRSYDSRDKGQGDFGVGWRLSLSNIRLQKNRNLSVNWQETQTTSGFIPQYCLSPTDNKIVTITFPDGRVFAFQVSNTPQCQLVAQFNTGTLPFTQMPGPSNTANATLTPADGGQFLVDGDVPGTVNLVGFDGLPYNPTTYILQTADGTKYTIDQRLGLTAVKDTNGNTLTITANGVTSSAGKSVPFARDEQGRITRITDPNGNSTQYFYNPNGDLASYQDRAANPTAYAYDSLHNLTGITGANGQPLLTNTFDPNTNRLNTAKDGNGQSVTFAYNVPNQQQTITDRNGNPTTYFYDADGNVLQVNDALGNSTFATYDANDNKRTATNALGKTTKYTYDGNGNPSTETVPLYQNNATVYTYSPVNKLLTVTDRKGNTTTNTYDPGTGNLKTTVGPAPSNNTTTNTYYPNGLLQTTTDPALNQTSFTYYSTGELQTQTDALGNVTTYTYDSNGNRLTQSVKRTLLNGTTQTLLTTYAYDGNDRLIKTIFPDTTFTQTFYNGLGQIDHTIDARGFTTSYQYDGDGHVKLVTYPDGTTEQSFYDFNGNRTKFVDRTTIQTTYTYDKLNHLTQTQRGSNPSSATITSTAYDAAGQVQTTTDANQNVTQYFYDDDGRRNKVTDPLSNSTIYAYDAADNLTSVQDANLHTTTYTYDEVNRQTQIKYFDNSTELTAYDADSRVISRTDANQKVTQYGYDKLGRLTSVVQDAGTNASNLNLLTKYGYDEVGNRISQTDASNHTTQYAYDQRGRRTQRILPMNQSESYTFDPNGNVATRTDFNGKTTTYTYDTMNRILTKTPDASFNAVAVTYVYSPATGQLQSMTDASGTTSYLNYDLNGHATQVNKPAGQLLYNYDPAGNLLLLHGNNNVNYTYDQLERLKTVIFSSINHNNDLITTYNYDAVGNVQSVTYPSSNGVTHTYTYDVRNRLKNLGVTNGGTTPVPIASYAYQVDAAGHRKSVTEFSGRNVTYSYDNIYRLTNETIALDPSAMNGSVTYAYDSVGNRTQKTSTLPGYPGVSSTYNTNDELTTDAYDANGNTTGSGSNTGTNGYVYDFENHLVQQGGITMVYDGNGNRVSKTVAGVTTTYLVDDQNPTGYAQVVYETFSGGSGAREINHTYVYGLDLISQIRQYFTGTQTLTPYIYYDYDGHGSVRALTDANGNVTDTYDYDAYGNLIHSTGSTPNNYLFAGEQFDPDLNLYYNRARYLNSSTGRFWTGDPLEGTEGDPSSHHRYLYAFAEPTDYVDPSGKAGYGIPNLFGDIVQKKVFADYQNWILTNGHIGYTNRAIKTILNLPSAPRGDDIYRRPDIADVTDQMLYEIKPKFAAAEAYSDIAYYIGLIMTNGGGYWTPGTRFSAPQELPIFGGFYRALIEPTVNGAILYGIVSQTPVPIPIPVPLSPDTISVETIAQEEKVAEVAAEAETEEEELVAPLLD